MLWPEVIDDFRHGRPRKPLQTAEGRTSLRAANPTGRIFRGKRYLPIGLIEAGRGCHFKCDFCARADRLPGHARPAGRWTEILAEIAAIQAR